MKQTYLLFILLFITLNACKNDDDHLETINPTAEHLIAYFPFNGDAINDIDPTHNGVVEGAILTTDINANENSAFYFDGIDDMISVNHQDIYNLSDEFTISALVYPEAIKTQHVIRKGASVNGSGLRPYSIGFSAVGTINFAITTENGQDFYHVAKEGYAINQWYLITGVYKDSEMFLYINGELEASTPVNGVLNTNSEPLLIGSRLGLPADTFKGTIDAIRIYDLGLNASQVRALYDAL